MYEYAQQNYAAQTAPPSDVEIELKMIDEAIKRLSNVSDMLALRLTSVLRSPVTDVKVVDTPEEIRVPLADLIRAKRCAIDHTANLLRGIVERLQL
jgi:hypothetical protein